MNESFGGKPAVVTYCPLCESGIVFDRRFEGKTRSFGNTGALYESGMVMYDRETGSLCSQPSGEALMGELAGTRLSV